MRVVMALRGMYPFEKGGAQRHSFCLISELAKLGGIELVVIHPHQSRGLTESPWITERPLGVKTGRYLDLIRYSRVVADVIAKDYPDADAAYGDGIALMSYLRRKRMPCIFDPRGMPAFQGDRSLKGFIARRHLAYCARESDFIRSLGGGMTDLIRKAFGAPPEKIFVVSNGIYVSEAACIAPARVREGFLIVGTLNRNKGIHLLDKICDEMSGTGAKIAVVGDGPLRAGVRALADRNVTHVGAVNDRQELSRLYSSAECLLLPSLRDGMPQVLWEGMANSLPIVATKVGAVQSMIREGANGFLCEPGDISGLAAQMKRFMSLGRDEKLDMGEASRRMVEDFDWPQVAKRFRDSLYSIVPSERIQNK